VAIEREEDWAAFRTQSESRILLAQDTVTAGSAMRPVWISRQLRELGRAAGQRAVRYQAGTGAARGQRSMFDRYSIIDEQDLARAVAKRLNGKQAANAPGAEQQAEVVS
jgi:hypothetical protein